MKGLPGAYDRFRSAVEAAWTELGNELSPVLEDVLGDLTEMVSTIADELIPVLKRWIPIIATVGKLIVNSIQVKVRQAIDAIKLFASVAGFLAKTLGIDGLAKTLGQVSDGLDLLNPKTAEATREHDDLADSVLNYDLKATEAKAATDTMSQSLVQMSQGIKSKTIPTLRDLGLEVANVRAEILLVAPTTKQQADELNRIFKESLDRLGGRLGDGARTDAGCHDRHVGGNETGRDCEHGLPWAMR